MILDGQQRIPRTISGYLDIYTSVGLPNNVDPRTFLFNVSKFNNQLPRNVSKNTLKIEIIFYYSYFLNRFIYYVVIHPLNY
jgi:hypothetical protein